MNIELIQKLKDAGFKFVTFNLSELILACGDRFENLTFYEGEWLANADYSDGGIAGEVTGSTPEESVANLWLALNKR